MMTDATALRSAEDMQTSLWTREALLNNPAPARAIIPAIDPKELKALIPDLDLWDMWALQERDGSISIINGSSYWFFLAAPRFPDPEARHDHARIRLLSHGLMGWTDRGNHLPEDFAPGLREWSGSAVREADGRTINLYFTAAGRREGGPRFEQRLFSTRGIFDGNTGQIRDWSTPDEFLVADGHAYAVAAQTETVDGMICGFRDPTYFRDPNDGAEYMVFTGTAVGAASIYDGVIGMARRTGDGWQLMPALIDAVGVNKELERPHIIYRDGLYYIFWSTHGIRFAQGLPGRTGLYGMVASKITGPWCPLNGSALVAGNPDNEPQQAYCWLVSSRLEVFSFANYPGLEGRAITDIPRIARSIFGGTIAPSFRLALSGDQAWIDGEQSK